MHGYSTDSDERRVVPLSWRLGDLWRGCLPILRGDSTSRSRGGQTLFPDDFLMACSTPFSTGILAKRFRVQIGTRQNPNLAGWLARYLISSFDGKRHNLVINVFQTWTQLAVFLATTTSISRSAPR